MRKCIIRELLPAAFICMFSAALVLCASGCRQRQSSLVEKTPENVLRQEEILVKVEPLSEEDAEKGTEEKKNVGVPAPGTNVDENLNKNEKNGQSLLMDEEGIPLDMHFADISGRSNPFTPPGASFGTSAAVTSAPNIPSYVNASSAVPTLPRDPLKGQLMPTVGQTSMSSPAIPPLPEWQGDSPVLSVGPPEQLNSLLDLTYRGLVSSSKSGKKAGVVELKAKKGTSGQVETLSYIVTPGKYVTEFNLKVKDLDAHRLILVRGSHRIELPLIEKGEYFTPSDAKGAQQSPYATKVGSNAQWYGSGGTGSSSQ